MLRNRIQTVLSGTLSTPVLACSFAVAAKRPAPPSATAECPPVAIVDSCGPAATSGASLSAPAEGARGDAKTVAAPPPTSPPPPVVPLNVSDPSHLDPQE